MDYIGIDPGKNGAIAIIADDQIITSVFDKTQYRVLLENCDPKNALCFVEKVSAMPKQGVTSMFNFGENFGFIEGLLFANRIPYQLITATKWKREFQITGDKNTSIEVCQRLFPFENLKRNDRCKKSHDGIAEALLLAEFARRASGHGKERKSSYETL